MMGPDQEMTLREIAKFTQKDAEAYPKYEAMLTRVADFLEPLLTQTPPDPWRPRRLWKLGQARVDSASSAGRRRAIEILTGAATPILDRWFESDD